MLVSYHQWKGSAQLVKKEARIYNKNKQKNGQYLKRDALQKPFKERRSYGEDLLIIELS